MVTIYHNTIFNHCSQEIMRLLFRLDAFFKVPTAESNQFFVLILI